MPRSSSDAVTVHEARIIIHIEYYFGDFNLLYDRFLQEKIEEDDGWVTIDTMLNCRRLKEITDDVQMICEALKKSSSGLMEVSEQGDKIRRSPSRPLPDDVKERREEIIAKTVYAKSFPLNVKLDDVQDFFKGYGQIDDVIMNKEFQKKTFKGSVFVTFANKEDAEKFVNEEETKFKEQALKVKCLKTNYLSHKAEQKKIKDKKDKEGKPHKKGEDKTNEEETEADLEEMVSKKMTKNAILHLKGLNSEISREQVKAFFSKHADVVYVDIVKDATQGYIRLGEPGSAGSTLEKAKRANDWKIVIGGSEIEVRVVEGDEELQYWDKMFKDIADKKHSDGGGSDGEEQDTEESSFNVIKSEKVMKMPQGKRKQNKEDSLSDGEKQDTEEPPAKVIKSEMIKFDMVMSFDEV
ncbi:hypothetical protein BsWGS_00880 [Bradybaena similaris]